MGSGYNTYFAKAEKEEAILDTKELLKKCLISMTEQQPSLRVKEATRNGGSTNFVVIDQRGMYSYYCSSQHMNTFNSRK